MRVFFPRKDNTKAEKTERGIWKGLACTLPVPRPIKEGIRKLIASVLMVAFSIPLSKSGNEKMFYKNED